jgi:iron complex transport system permease protein
MDRPRSRTVAGAAFLVWADLASRTILRPLELPVGILTAFVDTPFFLCLLKTQGRRL